MAEGPQPEVVLVYRQISKWLAFGKMAWAGDSHSREIGVRSIAPIKDIYQCYGKDGFRVSDQQFVRGGMTASGCLNDPVFGSLIESDSHIVALLCGGNDLDSLDVGHEDVARWHQELFNELTKHHKIVYIVENPTRFSVRTSGLTVSDYQLKSESLAAADAEMFGNRFIPLKPYCFERSNFEAKKHFKYGMEYVHLKEEFYSLIAKDVVDHIRDDLLGNKSPPKHPTLLRLRKKQ